jgi:hypothetical protein
LIFLESLEYFIELYLVIYILELLLSILSNRFRCSNESNQKTIRDRSSKVETAFPAEHMFAIVQFGLRPDASKHHIRVCACLAAQFAFFSRADSGVLLTAINAQATSSTFSINQSAKNVARNQAAPSSRVFSAQDDPGNCFNKLQLRWKTLCAHRDTDLYWSLADDSPSCFKRLRYHHGMAPASLG